MVAYKQMIGIKGCFGSKQVKFLEGAKVEYVGQDLNQQSLNDLKPNALITGRAEVSKLKPLISCQFQCDVHYVLKNCAILIRV